MLTHIRRLGTHRDMLGEGPIWSVLDEAFYWVDIRGKLLRCWHPETNEIRTWETPSMIGSVAPRASGGLVVALQDHVAFFDTKSGMFQRYRELPDLTPEQRLNDGKCDPDGNFWVGSMNIITRAPDGILYRISPSGDVEIVLKNLAVPNTLAWDNGGKSMFFSQTRDRRVYRYAFAGGSMVDPSLFYTTEEPGTPDGSTVDSEDHLWLAEYGNHQIVRLDQMANVSATVQLPCQYPTNCVFGGKDLMTVLITSGCLIIPEIERERRPSEGGTYIARSMTPGLLPVGFSG